MAVVAPRLSPHVPPAAQLAGIQRARAFARSGIDGIQRARAFARSGIDGIQRARAFARSGIDGTLLRLDWPLPAGSMPCLEELSVAKNPLKHVPRDAFHTLKSPCLMSLDLSATLGGVPASLVECSRMAQLNLAMMRLSTFPEQVLALKGLRILNLSDNKISSVPDVITCLTELREMNLTNNDISTLPNEMGLMGPKLNSLLLEGNCLKSIRRPILAKGTQAVLEYLRQRLPS
ncbi:hypothetical protein CYMTET_53481 [Cymbomonas tetramitiformis]|uniref:Uncharacterized protein n=1 Tax=Cymbomonas tetramitiformis TaxID=36881 RepID=A0AAE0EQJ6_9CHLO|nr:hypothetical protein CYMTET_53481 [Cymbomonas tetramitiformis]